jgi:hypothetical protein
MVERVLGYDLRLDGQLSWLASGRDKEARTHMGLESQRQWSELTITRTTPVRFALCSLVTLLALRLSQGGPMPVETAAWYPKSEPTFVDCLALVRCHLWRARYVVYSTTEPEFVNFTGRLSNAYALAFGEQTDWAKPRASHPIRVRGCSCGWPYTVRL